MQIPFQPAEWLDQLVRSAATRTEGFEAPLDPQIKPADPRFGDFQANGVLPYAKKIRQNPRALATALVTTVQADPDFSPDWVSCDLAGPGFINFHLTPAFYFAWLQAYRSESDLRASAQTRRKGQKVIVDYSSPNTAKEMHVGHIRSTVIGEAIARLLEFCGAETIRDNHIGDWGTQFGMLIWAIKTTGYDLDAQHEQPLANLESLYKQGHAAYKGGEAEAKIIRDELVKLQQGDEENLNIWKKISAISWEAFSAIYNAFDIHFDETLGESFYRDQVESIYSEMTETGIAVEDAGALVAFHPEHPRFSKQPFIIRKTDGASNYATTDLATVRYRTDQMGVDSMLYVVDSRQSDHFEQLFLTVKKWYAARGKPIPEMQHIAFGTILGENGKPIKTKEGGSVKLRELMREAIERSFSLVTEKNPDLPEAERKMIAEVIGLGAIRYQDLAQNRSSDYIFSWQRMLSLDGNTAPYILYAVARIHSIFRKAEVEPGGQEENASVLETPEEIALARQLLGFSHALDQTLMEFRPHYLCNYLYDLAGAFSTFYNANRVIVEEVDVQARRLLLCHRTLMVMTTGLNLLGLRTLEKM